MRFYNMHSHDWGFGKNGIKILLTIFCIHAIYIFIVHPPLQWFDSAVYDSTAWNFVQGLGFSYTPGIPDALREPGYSLFLLSPIYLLFGHSFLAVQLTQAFITAVTCVIIYRIGVQYRNERTGILAAFLYGVYPAVIVYSGEIMTETFFTFLLVAASYLFLQAIEDTSARLFFFTGVFLGAATLTRFVTLFFPFLLMIMLWMRYKKEWKKGVLFSGLLSFSFLLVILPWIIRNEREFHTLILGRTGGGEILWTGSYIPWDGDWQGYQWPLTDLVHAQNMITYDREVTKLAIQNIRQDPAGVALLWVKKPLKIYMVPEGLSFLLKYGAFNGNILLTILAIVAFVAHILLLFATGIGFLAKRHFPLFFRYVVFLFAYFIIIYMPLNGVARYAIPVYSILFIVTATGLWDIKDALSLLISRRLSRPRL